MASALIMFQCVEKRDMNFIGSIVKEAVSGVSLEEVPGVGPFFAKKLKDQGYETVSDIAEKYRKNPSEFIDILKNVIRMDGDSVEKLIQFIKNLKS
ncbi:hypothetical protein AB6A40_010572 [Gnathostoma spinigerum]|uniref:Uncharacterized protein n=1 Tax=Gnathostoma spinigerum TaxID=75299 RepID=A0ABD6F1Z8_9BILA